MAKPIEIDGRTGEGGGQVIRIAVCLAALTTQAIKIINIRGNRPKGGGLKNQHVASIRWLADATRAEVEGLDIGSKTLTFAPKKSAKASPLLLGKDGRHITIGGANASSTMLILQAVMPFLIFASGDPITLDVLGATHADFSPSYEYLDQVLLPTLEERWGIIVERELKRRSWSLGREDGGGKIQLKFNPLEAGQKLVFRPPTSWMRPGACEVRSIDITIIAPAEYHESMQNQLIQDIDSLFSNVDANIKILEDSKSNSRWYILLVANSAAGIRWGRDLLTAMPRKAKSADIFIAQICQKVGKALYQEVSEGQWMDEHLRDQLICYQSLCDGWSSMAPTESDTHHQLNDFADDMAGLAVGSQQSKRMRKEKAYEPFGNGSLHAQTARWVASELLPGLDFYNKGDDVKGVGFCSSYRTKKI